MYDASEDKFYGYCDFGGIQTESTETEAFMLVAMNGKWKWPIGYFQQSKCSTIIQAGLLKTAIIMAKDVGVRVWGITCDGSITNLSRMTFHICKINGSMN